MPRFVPDTLFSDCWSSVGNVTYYHRNGVCHFRCKAYSEFAGTAQRTIKAWRGLSSKDHKKWRRFAEGVAAHSGQDFLYPQDICELTNLISWTNGEQNYIISCISISHS